MIDAVAAMLLLVVKSQPVAALLSGGSPTSGDYVQLAGGVVERLLGEVLAVQDQTIVRLERIEQKLDRLIVEKYQEPMRAGFSDLEWAREEHRSADDRRRSLESARREFRRARYAAPTHGTAVDAELLVATCCLAMGEPLDFLQSTAQAADAALAGVVWTGLGPDESMVHELWDSRANTLDRLLRRFGAEEMSDERAELRRQAAQRRAEYTASFNAIQAVRRQAGVSRRESPRIGSFLELVSWRLLDLDDAGGVAIGFRRLRDGSAQQIWCPVFEYPARIAGVTVRWINGRLTAGGGAAALQPGAASPGRPGDFAGGPPAIERQPDGPSRPGPKPRVKPRPLRAPPGRLPPPSVPAALARPRLDAQTPADFVVAGSAYLEAARGIRVDARLLPEPFRPGYEPALGAVRESTRPLVRSRIGRTAWTGGELDASRLPAPVALQVRAKGPKRPLLTVRPTHLVVVFRGVSAPADAVIERMTVAFVQPLA